MMKSWALTTLSLLASPAFCKPISTWVMPDPGSVTVPEVARYPAEVVAGVVERSGAGIGGGWGDRWGIGGCGSCACDLDYVVLIAALLLHLVIVVVKYLGVAQC